MTNYTTSVSKTMLPPNWGMGSQSTASPTYYDAQPADQFYTVPKTVGIVRTVSVPSSNDQYFTVPKTISIDTEAASSGITITPDMVLAILDTDLDQAPTVLTFQVSGGVPQVAASLFIDGVDELDFTLDAGGGAGPFVLAIATTDAFGSQGSHSVHVEQVNPSTGATLSTPVVTYTIALAPQVLPPGTQPADAQAVTVPQPMTSGVRHFVLQDLAPGGLGSYVFPINPAQMTSPHQEYAISATHTTAVHSGQLHITQAGSMPHEWQLTGYAPTQEMQDSILAYRNLNRRFYVIDHRNRAWKCVFTNASFVPRTRQSYNGTITDWGADYTLTFVVLDQDWVTPS